MKRIEMNCPSCERIIELNAQWIANNQAPEFTFDCEHCKELLTAEIEQVAILKESKTGKAYFHPTFSMYQGKRKAE